MGYYSTLSTYPFKSKYNSSQAEEILRDAMVDWQSLGNGEINIDGIDNDPDYLEIYTFKDVGTKEKKLELDCEGGYYAKHYADYMIAKVISQLIDDDCHVDLYFYGEVNELWGYRVRADRISSLCCVWKEDETIYPIETNYSIETKEAS